MNQPGGGGGPVEQNDKLLAAASYPVAFIISLIILLTDMKNKPFLKYHAVQSLVVNAILTVLFFVVSTIISVLTLGIGALCTPILWLGWLGIDLYWAYQAYQGQYLVIPYVTKFMQDQHWV